MELLFNLIVLTVLSMWNAINNLRPACTSGNDCPRACVIMISARGEDDLKKVGP
jgi:hypothetical protein